MSFWPDELYRLLPQVYRTRDGANNDDLRKLLEACGALLDSLHGALLQRLADSLPGHPDLQGWLLPYLAALVDERLIAPDESGRRDELENATTWRQRKGTARIVAPIVRAVGRYGAPGPDGGRMAAVEGWTRVATTPRMGSGPRREVAPTLVNVRRAPPRPGAWDDTSLRTPDVRRATFRSGHFHPRRLIVFVAPRSGFFATGWDAGTPDQLPSGPGAVLEGKTFVQGTGQPTVDGAVSMTACTVIGDLLLPDGGESTIVDSIVTGTLRVRAAAGQVVWVQRCAIANLVIESISPDGAAPSVVVQDSLLGRIEASGPGRLLAVTVVGGCTAAFLQVSDSLLVGPAAETNSGAETCFRFSRVTPEILRRLEGTHHLEKCTAVSPLFAETTFGKIGCGVLHPACKPLRSWAENGGEVGAYNHLNHALRDRAVLEKLKEYLPFGMEPVLVPDPYLLPSVA